MSERGEQAPGTRAAHEGDDAAHGAGSFRIGDRSSVRGDDHLRGHFGGQPVGHRLGLLHGGRLDHHPHEPLRAAGAQQDPPVVAQLGVACGRGRRRARPPPRPRAGCTCTLRSTCGRRVMASSASTARGRPECAITSSSCTAVRRPSPVVARSANTTWPLCSPPRLEPALGEGREDVAIADRHLHDLDAVRLHAEPEPEVRHHGDDHGVAGEHAARLPVDGGDGDDLVAVDQPPVGVDRQHPIGVAVERDPDVGPGLHDGPLEVVGVGGAAAGVDVGAVGVGVEHLDLGAERPQHLGADLGGRPVGAVDHHAEAVEAATLGGRDDRLHPSGGGVVVVGDGAESTPGPRRAGGGIGQHGPQLGLEGVLLLVGRASDRPGRTASRRCPRTGCARPRSPRRAPRRAGPARPRWASGTTPSRTTSTPSLVSPAMSAASSNGPTAECPAR